MALKRLRGTLGRLVGRGAEGAPAAARDRAARDFAATVLAIGRSPLFDADWYAKVYPDVAAGGTSPAWHFAEHGWREGRDPGPGFSTRGYLAKYPEAAAGPLNPLLHFESVGRALGWTPPPSRASAPPVARPEDLALIRESPFFDAAWYHQAYPDTVASDPALHFLLQGHREKRNPGPGFRTREYLLANPDVAESGVNPLLHYLREGRAEGRRLRYLQVMQRVAGKGVCLATGEAIYPDESAAGIDEADPGPPSRPPSRSLFLGFEPPAIEGMMRRRSVVDPGIDPEVAEYRDVWLLPAFHALYDANGERIDASLRDTLIAGPASDRPLAETKARLSRLSPDRIVPPDAHDIVEAPHLYGGQCIPHYGHFLTNAMARFWALERFGDLPMVFPATQPDAYRAPYARVVLKALGVLPRLVKIARPTLFRRMVIPSPSLESGQRIYRCFDAPHLRVAEQALARREPRFEGKKIYLSRAALGDASSRRVLQERQVETWLTGRGFVSIAPETLHLADQIDLFNSAETIAGMIGSAFHTAAFARPAHRSRLIALGWQRMNGRYLLIDELKGHTAFYVNCCRVETYTDKGRIGEVSLDVDTAIAGLELALRD
ncbi:MAG: glycosyltransferase family 61 protein [Alphaproteobacteria bacterium]|nr:glycosyltransferase family 61 protein [Alphaproteobacteria bacterium]